MQILDLRVFSRVPDAYRVADRRSDWNFGRRHRVDCFIEGPVFDAEGNLYVTDIPYGRIFRVSRAGEWTLVAEYDGWPNGLALRADGTLLIADHLKGLCALDPRTGRVEILLATARREGFKGLNDLIVASNGDAYFTDQGQTGLQDPTGRVYRLTAGGRLDCLIDCVPGPNGLALTSDETVLLVAATRANQIWRLPLHEDGTTTKVSAFISLSGGLAGPDGMAVDGAGNILVAHCGLGVVWLFDRLGEPRLRLRSPLGISTTNLALDPLVPRRLVVTESDTGSLLDIELPAD